MNRREDRSVAWGLADFGSLVEVVGFDIEDIVAVHSFELVVDTVVEDDCIAVAAVVEAPVAGQAAFGIAVAVRDSREVEAEALAAHGKMHSSARPA